jgi:putative membrane-bound dehydrogenase-like protein
MTARLCLLSLLPAAFAHAEIPAPTDAPKPLSPEASAAAFKLPEGFRMEVIASEPLIASPSGICWDERGRMFVSELHGYNLEGQLDIDELNKTGQLDVQVRRVQADERFKQAARAGTYGVVKALYDTNSDGRMDKADTWATNLPPAYGLVPARGGVIVACAPDIVFLADRDGDGQAEVRETLFTGFRTGPLERGINSPQWSVDGWIYCGRGSGGGQITGPKLAGPVTLGNSDFRFRADGSAIEPVTGGTHTFGFAMTEAGDRFVMATTTPGIFVAPLPWRYLARNPDAAFTSLEVATGDRRVYPLAPAHPWRTKRAEDPAYSKFYRDRYGAAESEASGWFTSACGPMIYYDSVLPGLRGQYFVCEPAGNLIHRAEIEEDGPMLKLRRAPGEEKSEFAASRDAWSHPIALTHGPDGAIWIVDYYREIIEDYSAIPRHLQQQYGLYSGHDRGRIYRLTHRDAPRGSNASMAGLETKTLARECASPLFWRRQTAQRLLAERGDKSAAPVLREMLKATDSEASAIIAALRTLDALRALAPDDLRPAIEQTNSAIRVHALQLADRWFNDDGGHGLLNASFSIVLTDFTEARVNIQLALSWGESDDPGALVTLAVLACRRSSIRWMDAAMLSSLHERGAQMLERLLGDPSGCKAFLPLLAESIAARREEAEFARTLDLLKQAKPEIQAAVLGGLVKGRKNAPRKPLGAESPRTALAAFVASSSAEVRTAARALEETFVANIPHDDAAGALPPVEVVSDATFRKFVTALSGPRNPERGHEIFVQACATCHRISNEGHHVGPDLLGQIGMGEESLLQDILMPNARIRPGFETTLVELRDGTRVIGLLKDDGPTSLTLMSSSGVEQALLRKDIAGVRRLGPSLMPSFADSLTPTDVASVLSWLRTRAASVTIDPPAK